MVKSKFDRTAFDAIKQAMELVLDEKEVITKSDLKFLPSKEEFYEQTLKILKSLDDLKMEKDLLAAHSKDHTDRIEALEKIHPHGKHATII